METICFFNDCVNPALPGRRKCAFHIKKGICAVPDCRNQVYARGHCIRHGGRKACQVPGCAANARVRGRCARHMNTVLDYEPLPLRSPPSAYEDNLSPLSVDSDDTLVQDILDVFFPVCGDDDEPKTMAAWASLDRAEMMF
ncbi:Aste57867_8986 [Aphanomyces stellatus]|uniref:Aste57867_8986 protein n=1 Tax=Aphanomyces stellatus TaxID=120398 RepID=A0A485KLM5_9STRA|nr:hypothetical protein As57867_008951 [Aphanomyces stellatus]VFT85870.1 Aste57867_8986 [Aphanomyces stellatus]